MRVFKWQVVLLMIEWRQPLNTDPSKCWSKGVFPLWSFSSPREELVHPGVTVLSAQHYDWFLGGEVIFPDTNSFNTIVFQFVICLFICHDIYKVRIFKSCSGTVSVHSSVVISMYSSPYCSLYYFCYRLSASFSVLVPATTNN